MKTALFAALLLATPAAAQTTAAPATPAAPASNTALTCMTGSVAKTFGGSPWLVHGCSDGHSIAIVADTGSKAVPCTFTMQYQSDGGYQAHGRCSGDKTVTQAAFDDIGNLNAGQVKALYDQTQPAAPAER